MVTRIEAHNCVRRMKENRYKFMADSGVVRTRQQDSQQKERKRKANLNGCPGQNGGFAIEGKLSGTQPGKQEYT